MQQRQPGQSGRRRNSAEDPVERIERRVQRVGGERHAVAQVRIPTREAVGQRSPEHLAQRLERQVKVDGEEPLAEHHSAEEHEGQHREQEQTGARAQSLAGLGSCDGRHETPSR